MNQKTILILPGDGIGKEITVWGQRVLEVVTKDKLQLEFKHGLIGHSAIDQTGTPLPDETVTAAKNSDAVLLGAVGHPKYDNDPSAKVRPEQGLLKIRKELGLYSNIRPIKLFESLLGASSLKEEILRGSDILFFRELTGGIYFGQPSERRENGTVALDTMIYSKEEVKRIAIQAFEAAMKRSKKVTSVDKANVLESSRLWRETVIEVSDDYPDVELVHLFIDAATMKLIENPNNFDVVVTGNLFGDILTDEASQIAGSMGMLASASVGNKIGLYEPIHGSAHDITGKGIANPLATILSVALMLEIQFDMKLESDRIYQAVDDVLKQGFRTMDIKSDDTVQEKILNTKQIGEKIIQNLQ